MSKCHTVGNLTHWLNYRLVQIMMNMGPCNLNACSDIASLACLISPRLPLSIGMIGNRIHVNEEQCL